MSCPRISVVTVTRNDKEGLARTIDSVARQDYANLQYVVADGDSSDGSRELIEARRSKIDVAVSEADAGIYHAMNKAIEWADGEWLLFMNAGDVFVGAGALSSAAACISDGVDVVYSDWLYRESGRRVTANKEKMIVRHQSVIYRKCLHQRFGNYVVGPGVSISDFIFFQSIAGQGWAYCKEPISECEMSGVSADPKHFYQRIATEFLFGRRDRLYTAAILVAYPAYRILKKLVLGGGK